ncbi:MAG: SCO family protein [Rheinheimera sp.]|uniref:SCO family protein n=1 Tax=Arsukibacterium sp. UBA3155 TaxID=1946058 RepID=UPI000C89284C|nr:SCO family protein [Arsukibacterium sp. UBA3155]MAD75301.1 SCO family protein [Rheinheimera sp.]|tara:strand:- start:117542 stop:118132 length:591 start_codon:yes stop_codon:yes gene_type:complete
MLTKHYSALLCLLLLYACSKPDHQLSLQYATVLTEPRPLAHFQLQDQHGNAFSNTDLEGSWTILFSGFTYCPDICPLTLGQLLAAEQQMTGSRQHKIVFITVDPERDTPASLKQYLGLFQPQWIGLTGKPENLSKLLDSMGLAQVRIPSLPGENYSIEHSTAIVLLNPQGKMAGYWKAPLDTAQLAADFSLLPATN